MIATPGRLVLSAERRCWLCRRPITRDGQRGPLRTHPICRRLNDAGMRQSQIRERVSRLVEAVK